MKKRALPIKILWWISYILRWIIFIPLLLLRGILQWVLKIAGGIFLVFSILSVCLGMTWGETAVFFVVGAAAEFLGFAYDSLLFKLNPTGDTLILYK